MLGVATPVFLYRAYKASPGSPACLFPQVSLWRDREMERPLVCNPHLPLTQEPGSGGGGNTVQTLSGPEGPPAWQALIFYLKAKQTAI